MFDRVTSQRQICLVIARLSNEGRLKLRACEKRFVDRVYIQQRPVDNIYILVLKYLLRRI